MKNKKILIWSAVAVALFILLLCCTKMVDNSEIGIKFRKFSLTEQGELKATQVSGIIFYNPITTDVFTYPVYIQRVDYSPFTVTTKDAAEFLMDPLLAYQLDRSKATYVFNKYRRPLRDIEAGYMRTCIYDAYRICANNYTSDELMANRAKFEAEVRAMLEKSLEDEGFKVNEFTSQITPPASLSAAIEAKNQAIQEALKAENLVKQAEANAQIAIAKAKGEAEATRVRADAEAYYNRTIAASLSPFIIQEDWIEKWDGKLPEVSAGQGAGMMINLPALNKQ
jgi:regulator of protease activity HflC (stomatin/prohibitin superfamily)